MTGGIKVDIHCAFGRLNQVLNGLAIVLRSSKPFPMVQMTSLQGQEGVCYGDGE